MNDKSAKTASSAGHIPFYVSFGVTGHRSLPDSDQIAERIREIFRGRYRECFDQETSLALPGLQATHIAFTVVSALASGADQLVARIAMEHQARLEAVLPFAKEEYFKDFAPEPLVHFNDLLHSANRCIQLEGDVTGAADPGEARRDGYLRAGKYVLEHCDVLIAIWDGEPARGKGGTAEIVALALERKKPVFIISTKPPYGAILRNGERLQGRNLLPLDEFNSFPLRDDEIRKRAEEDLAGMYNDPSCREIPESLKQMVSERLLPCYARASIIAEQNQKRYQRTAMRGYTITTLSVFILAIAVMCRNEPNWSLFGINLSLSGMLFFVELILLLYLSLMVHHAKKDQVHRKWLECRSMAERLRIAFFFVSCGVRPIMFSDTARLLIDIERRDWVGAAFENILKELPNKTTQENKACSWSDIYICTKWIESQKDYHKRKALKAEQKNLRLEWMRNAAFILAIILSISHIIISGKWLPIQHIIGHQAQLIIENVVSIIAITMPAAGAAVEGYRTLMEYPRISSRCNAMKAYLEQLLEQSSKLTCHHKLSSLLVKTEKLMLIESQDWNKLLRFADLEKVI